MTGRGGLCTQHGQAQLFQCRGEGDLATHISPDGPGSVTRGKSTSEPQIPMGKDTLANKTTDGVTTARGGGVVSDTQKEGRQE